MPVPDFSQNKKVLITGASGFIGSFLVEEGLLNGYRVYAGIRAGSKRIFLQDPSIRFFELDFSSPERLEKKLREFILAEGRFDYVIHNAGITRAGRKEDFHRVNYQYTKHLADALVATGSPPEKFIFISSLAAGGPGDPLRFTEINSSDPDHPISSYAKSKLDAEKYISSLPGLRPLIIRPTAVYGPRDRDFLNYFRILSKGIAPCMGSRRQILSFIYVKDLSRAVFKLLSSGRIHRSYLASDGNSYTNEDMLMLIWKIVDKPAIKIRVPLAPVRASVFFLEKLYSLFNRMPFLHCEKLEEITALNWSCNSSELWQDLGTAPKYSLEAGLYETARWYRENGWLV